MKKMRIAFISFILLFFMSSIVNAKNFELDINSDNGTGIIEGKIKLEEELQYERLTVKVLNEEEKIIYLDQVYTDELGEAEFKYFHNNGNAGDGVMTVNVIHEDTVMQDTYIVEEKKVMVTCNSVFDNGSGSYEMSYTLNNVSQSLQKIDIFTAVYEDDGKRLKKIQHKHKDLAVGEKFTDVDTSVVASGETIVTFFWETDTLAPYCDKLVWIESDEEESEPTPTPTPDPVPTMISIEGEEGTAEFSTQLLSGDGVSGELMHLYKTTFDPDADYTVEYTFDSAAAGVYELTGVVSEFTGYTADCSLSVNGEAAIHSSSAEKIEDVTIGVAGLSENILDKFSFGQVYLNQGKNTLTLNIEGKNWNNTSVAFDADYFAFVPVTDVATAASVQKSGLNIFELKNGATFNIVLDGVADSEKEIQYAITDYFGNECKNSSVVIPKGEYKCVINETLPTGWYELNISSELIDACEKFVVVPNYDDRMICENSAFATDIASAWHTDSYYEQRLYANAAKLAGSDWVRDRFLWREVESSDDVYDFNQLIGDTDTLKDEGLMISNVFHESPSWAKTSGGSLPDNPQIMYDFIKSLSDNMTSYVDVWEIWNEQDAYAFSKEGADKYSAMLKAAAIAADNSENNPLIALGGLCTRDSEYNNQVFQNGVMDYIDIYNYHTHLNYDIDDGGIPVPQKEYMEKYALLSRLYGTGNKPIWHTESGIRQAIKDGETQLNAEQCVAQAQHIVPAYLEAVATGVDKQFSFIGLPFEEGGADFGLFDNEDMPRPAYAAQAVMSKILEGMSFYGNIHSLPDSAVGYAMHDDSSVCEILWSEEETAAYIEASDNVKAYDIMGKEISLTVADGKALITLSPNPVYVMYSIKETPSNIYVRQLEFDAASKAELTEADKIVLYAQFPVTNIETDKAEGYSLSYSDENTVSVTVYNFSDSEMSGTLNAVAENGEFDIDTPTETVTILPHSETVVNIDVTSNTNTAFCKEYDIKIGGVFNGENISPVVAHINFNRGINEYTALNGADSIRSSSARDGWQEPTVSSNIAYDMTTGDDGIQFTLMGDGTSGIFYPFVYSRYQNLSEYDGITMSVYCDKSVDKSATDYMTIQILNSNGNFSLDYSKTIAMKQGWNSYAFKWSDFTQRNSGTASSINDILGAYMYVRIGVHTSQTALTYKLDDVGLFNNGEDNAVLPEITASYIKDNNGISVDAVLPDEVSADNVLVYYDGIAVDSYTISDNEITFNDAMPDDGTHTILVVAYTPTGYAIYKEIEIK